MTMEKRTAKCILDDSGPSKHKDDIDVKPGVSTCQSYCITPASNLWNSLKKSQFYKKYVRPNIYNDIDAVE